VENEETSIARQWLGKYVFVATNTHATIGELLEAVFSMGSVPKFYKEDQREQDHSLLDWTGHGRSQI
jgi:hypothetical protein